MAIRDLKRSDDRVLAQGALVTVSSRGATGVLQLVTEDRELVATLKQWSGGHVQA